MRASLNIFSNFSAGIWAAAVGLLALPVYLRYLGIESFGLVGFLLTLQAWFLLLDMGLSPTSSREMARYSGGQHTPQGIRDLFTSFEYVYAALAVLLALALAASSRWLATDWLQLQSLPVDAASRAISLLALLVAVQWMATLYRSCINGLQRQTWLAGLTVAMSSLRALATVAVLAWIAPTLDAFVLAQTASYVLEAALLRWYLHLRLPALRGRFRPQALKAVWQFAAGMTAIAVLATLLNQMDKLLLARLLPLEQFGYFTLAMTVIGAMSIVVTPIFNAAYPRLAELVASDQPSLLAGEYHALSQIAAFTVLPIAATLLLFAPEAVYAWTGNRELTAQVAPIVAVWTLGSALNGLLHVPYALQLAVGWVRLSIVLNLVAVVVMLPSILWLVPRYGTVAAGWIWAIVNLFYFIAGVLVMHARVLPAEAGRWYARDLGLPCAAIVGVMFVALALRSWWLPSGRVESAALVAAALLASGLGALLATPTGRALAGTVARAARSGQVVTRQ